MMSNRKSFVFGTILIVVFLLLSAGFVSPVQVATAEDFTDGNKEEGCLDEFCSEHSHTINNNQFICSTVDGDSYSCSFPLPDNISEDDVVELTDEEIGVLLCSPEYVTPKRVSIQNDDLDDLDGQKLTLNPSPVKVALFIDEEAREYYATKVNTTSPYTWEGCKVWAKNILDCGTAVLYDNYQIDFQAHYYEAWTLPNGTSYRWMLTNSFGSGTVAPQYGCDVIVLLSGQADAGLALGCAEHRSFAMDVNIDRFGFPCPPTNLMGLFQHEASHLFKCKDHQYLTSPPICIMTNSNNYLEYCDECDEMLWLNQFRYDLKGYAYNVTKTDKTGFGQVYDPDNIKGDYADKNYARLYSQVIMVTKQ